MTSHGDVEALDDTIVAATRAGDATALGTLLDRHPEKRDLRIAPYEWTLLHLAASAGHLDVVDLLLGRGIDVNARESGDRTYAMHWAAAGGHVEVVRRLADAGGDVVGEGDDHELAVIGWATCWEGGDDAAHRAVADLLIARGARHHIFSAIALGLEDEVRRIVAADPGALHRRLSSNEAKQLPLHFAVRRGRPEMVELLLTLGADALGVDEDGFSAAAYATEPDVDRAIMLRVRTWLLAELESAQRGHRPPHTTVADLIAALALGEWELAAIVMQPPNESGQSANADTSASALAMMAKRGDTRAVAWLLAHGADVNARWHHWDAEVTPLHLAILGGHDDVARQLLAAGADPSIRDDKHDGNALDWARFFQRRAIESLLVDAPATVHPTDPAVE